MTRERELLERAVEALDDDSLMCVGGTDCPCKGRTVLLSDIRAFLATTAPVTPETPKREQIHLESCDVPRARFADDSRCTCGLREQVDALADRAAQPKEEKPR